MSKMKWVDYTAGVTEEELGNTIIELIKKCEALEKQLEEQRSLNHGRCVERIVELEVELSNLQMRHSIEKKAHDLCAENEEALEKQVAELKNENADLEASRGRLSRQEKEYLDRCAERDALQSQVATMFSAAYLTSVNEQNNQRVAQLHSRLVDLEIDHLALKSKLAEKDTEVDHLRSRLAEMIGKDAGQHSVLVELKKKLEVCERDRDHFERQEHTGDRIIENLEAKLAAVEAEIKNHGPSYYSGALMAEKQNAELLQWCERLAKSAKKYVAEEFEAWKKDKKSPGY